MPVKHIHPYTHLQDELNLDAIDLLLLIAELESRFNVYLTPEEAEAIETVFGADHLQILADVAKEAGRPLEDVRRIILDSTFTGAN